MKNLNIIFCVILSVVSSSLKGAAIESLKEVSVDEMCIRGLAG
jgi:hypothetical protein